MAGLQITNLAGIIDPNLDVFFNTQTDADNYLDTVLNGQNTGNDDDARAAFALAKGKAYGGHFATMYSMPAAPNGAGFRRFTESPQGAAGFLTGPSGEAGAGRDSMGVVVS